jgi:hypothetical protein
VTGRSGIPLEEEDMTGAGLVDFDFNPAVRLARVYVCACVYIMYVCVYVCMCMCVCVYIYIYMYIQTYADMRA